MSTKNSKSCYMSAPLIRHKQQKELQNKADTLRANDFFKEAAGTYLNSILIDRNNAETYYGLGVCYKNLGKTDKAVEYLEKSILLDNTKYETFYELGLCHLKNKIPCKAIKCFIQAIQLEPDNSDAIYHLGLAHEMCEEPDMAIMIYQKLIENAPVYLNAYVRKAALLMKMDLYRQALGICKQVLKINPNYTNIYSDMGKCFDKLGKTTDAKRYYRKFLASSPDLENASVIMNRVEKLRQIKKCDNKFTLV